MQNAFLKFFFFLLMTLSAFTNVNLFHLKKKKTQFSKLRLELVVDVSSGSETAW
mgnify:CR=1 FL=1